MTFLNPLGLLALLAIPIILGLHFFRQQKKSRQVGGLHLWDFARIATPAGRRFERLRATLPLLFQLLAALLLALLLAGLDLPTKKSARHYSVIIDDSVSMQARVDGSVAAKRAVEEITNWAGADDQFTLVAASARPAVLAGPAASKTELVRALAAWSPRSTIANVDEAVNIAAKFGTESSRIIFVTDDPKGADHLKAGVSVWGVGRAAPNNGIIFADRFRASEDADKIIATIQRFGGGAVQETLTVYRGDEALASQPVDLQTSIPVSVELNLPAVGVPLRLALTTGDPLAADDSVILAPVNIKPVKIFIAEGLPQRESFKKAASAVREVLFAPTVAEADLEFTNSRNGTGPARRSYLFPDVQSTESLRIATGRDLVTSEESIIAQNLSLAGVTWPFDRSTAADPRTALRADISYTSIPLLYTERSTSASEHYRVNLALDSTNIFRQPAWPVLIMNMIEECRSALPGLSRVNLRAGEELRVNLEPDPAGAQVFTLWREGEPQPVQTWQDEPPAMLNGLPPGTYRIRQGDTAESSGMGMFRVNLFSQSESDLRPLSTIKPNLTSLLADTMQHTERNYLLYYLMLAALIGCVILGWVYHDAGH